MRRRRRTFQQSLSLKWRKKAHRPHRRWLLPAVSFRFHALRNTPAKNGKLMRILEEIDNLFKLFFGFINTGNICKGYLVVSLHHQPGPVLAKRQSTAFAASLHLPHEENPYSDQQQHWEPGYKNGHGPAVFRHFLDIDVNTGISQDRNELCVSDRINSPERCPILQCSGNSVTFDPDTVDRFIFNL